MPLVGTRFTQVAAALATGAAGANDRVLVTTGLIVALDDVGQAWRLSDDGDVWRPLPHHPDCACDAPECAGEEGIG